jgi:hypothetical protein
MPSVDFTLPGLEPWEGTDETRELVFDAGYREAKNPILAFYRGYW